MAQLISLDVGLEIAYIVNNEAAGIIGGCIVPCLFTGDSIAVEQYWYVLPEFRKGRLGLSLLSAFESEVKRRGAKRCYIGNLAALNNDKMKRLYKLLGYKELETHFVKPL
jgi:ribosomal protein S18 acetylase RimI-like enzyme